MPAESRVQEMADTSNDGSVQVIFRLGDLLDIIALKSPVSLHDLTRDTGLPKTTVHRLLRSLEDTRMVTKIPKGFIMGPRIGQWQAPADHYRQLALLSQPILNDLAAQTMETASLFIGLRDHRRCLAVAQGLQEIRHVLQPDDTFPLGIGSSGKLLLGGLSRPERVRALDATSVRFPEVEIPRDALDEELDKIFDRGCAVSLEEREVGLAAVSCLLGSVKVACLSITGPASRFDVGSVERFMKMLKDAADSLDAVLSHASGKEISH